LSYVPVDQTQPCAYNKKTNEGVMDMLELEQLQGELLPYEAKIMEMGNSL